MRVGTKSVLFGAHQFLIHPWFVAAAWWKLFGFPLDPRLWVAFFVHDLGYIGKPNMDGPEGEEHVWLGARILHSLFDRPKFVWKTGEEAWSDKTWMHFSLCHSRFYAKKLGIPASRLCVADKYAICLTPAWLYLPMVRWTGEIHEYIELAQSGKYQSMNTDVRGSQRDWYLSVQEYLCRWVAEHKDGKADTWTPTQRKAIDANGVWQ